MNIPVIVNDNPAPVVFCPSDEKRAWDEKCWKDSGAEVKLREQYGYPVKGRIRNPQTPAEVKKLAEFNTKLMALKSEFLGAREPVAVKH